MVGKTSSEGFVVEKVAENSFSVQITLTLYKDKSSAVAEMGDRGHNRHGPKRGGLLCPFRGSWDAV